MKPQKREEKYMQPRSGAEIKIGPKHQAELPEFLGDDYIPEIKKKMREDGPAPPPAPPK